jgi:hypothetical protein
VYEVRTIHGVDGEYAAAADDDEVVAGRSDHSAKWDWRTCVLHSYKSLLSRSFPFSDISVLY